MFDSLEPLILISAVIAYLIFSVLRLKDDLEIANERLSKLEASNKLLIERANEASIFTARFK
jgi:hypothetical protein